MTDHVFIAGPASWNQIVYLDHLPEPVPHMQFALDEYETIGGTSAGKALGLAGLGQPVVLHALFGGDVDGERVRALLEWAGVTVIAGAGGATERHLNLMTPAGERVSLYLTTPTQSLVAPEPVATAMAAASAIVLDLAPVAQRLIPLATAAGRPVWTDIHDYDGSAEFHRPFIEAADVIFMNADRIGPDPLPFMRARVEAGASLVVCTLGERGAIAVARDASDRMSQHEVEAVPVAVRDTNGAGDAFMTGVLDATLAGAGVPDALRAGAEHAASVLGTRHLHPSLDEALGR
ncbi:carbohydrate kinase family protein [Agromyces neolithicus]|uniref:carbohydrate kinase family protein n=1 Tax=Agromyces neolithicus TaxID=269420 RepID=UPI0031E366AB